MSGAPAGYLSRPYVDSLDVLGTPRRLPASGGWLLVRDVPGRGVRDAVAPYPLLLCQDWSRLGDDLGDAAADLVTVAGVTDPLAPVPGAALADAFPDLLRVHKQHFLADLADDPARRLPRHHRRRLRAAAGAVSVVEVDPPAALETWCELYGVLRERHGITGVPAFSRRAFRRQLATPGVRVFAARAGTTDVAMLLWYRVRRIAYYHLGASSSAGYALGASYAAMHASLETLAADGCEVAVLGGGLRSDDPDRDGLARFKAGWSARTAPAFLVGRVTDHRLYARLCGRPPRPPALHYFPAYRGDMDEFGIGGRDRDGGGAPSPDLAVLGGPPAFPEPLHVGRPNIGDRDVLAARLAQVLDARWLTNGGPMSEAFEGAVAEVAGVEHCVATVSGTAGLEIAARASGLRGQVIVPGFTFVATAHAFRWLGLEPVFCDVDPHTHTIDPRRVEELITDATSGIVGVHLWGRPCATDALQEIADRHRLVLLFDAAHAFGCRGPGGPVGAEGTASVFSFHATKFVNSFEGGAIVTSDPGFAERARRLRNFGFLDYDLVGGLGTNGKMHEASAAMGLTSLDSMPVFAAVNRRNHQAYRRGLDGLPGVRLVEPDAGVWSNHQYVVAEIDPVHAPLTRDEVHDVLWREGVRVRRYFTPGCHRTPPYDDAFRASGRRLPVTERLADTVLCFPTGTAVDEATVDRVCALVGTAFRRAADVRTALGRVAA